MFSFYFSVASVVFKNVDLFDKKQYYNIFQFNGLTKLNNIKHLLHQRSIFLKLFFKKLF